MLGDTHTHAHTLTLTFSDILNLKLLAESVLYSAKPLYNKEHINSSTLYTS